MVNRIIVFPLAIITMTGPDKGVSLVTIPYDIKPCLSWNMFLHKTRFANLACFFYHWWQEEAGYHESTVKQNLSSFYFDCRVTVADTCDPVITCPTSRYFSASDMWLEDNAHLNPNHSSTANFSFGTTDKEHVSLFYKFNYKDDQ